MEARFTFDCISTYQLRRRMSAPSSSRPSPMAGSQLSTSRRPRTAEFSTRWTSCAKTHSKGHNSVSEPIMQNWLVLKLSLCLKLPVRETRRCRRRRRGRPSGAARAGRPCPPARGRRGARGSRGRRTCSCAVSRCGLSSRT